MPENRAVVNGATAIGGSTLVGAVVVRCHPPRTCVAARLVPKTPHPAPEKISTRAWFSKHTVPDCHAPKDSNKFKWNSC